MADSGIPHGDAVILNVCAPDPPWSPDPAWTPTRWTIWRNHLLGVIERKTREHTREMVGGRFDRSIVTSFEATLYAKATELGEHQFVLNSKVCNDLDEAQGWLEARMVAVGK